MAFVSRTGSILKQLSTKHINMELSVSNLSLYQAVRCMSTKLFVGGLSYGTDEASLREVFARYGQVDDVRIITDYNSGRSRGFGFVNFSSSEDANAAMRSMDGQAIQGRTVRVNIAADKPRAGGFGGGGVGVGGGYGGNYGGSGGGYGGNYGGGGGGGGSGYGGNYGGGGGGGYRGNYGGSGGGGYGGSSNSNAGGYGSYGGGGYGSGNNSNAGGYGNYYGGGVGSYTGGNSGGYGGVSSSGNYGVAGGGDNNFGGGSSAGEFGDSDSAEAKYGYSMGIRGDNESFSLSNGDKDDNGEPDEFANTRG